MNEKDKNPNIYVMRVNMTPDALKQFMDEFNAMQEELAEDILAATELTEARYEIARIMEASRGVR